MRTSKFLIQGTVYTRKELSDAFRIEDATINNGIFQPKGHDSLWLFVTKNKTPDRVQYNDHLENDVLSMESQKFGRNDQKMINHLANKVEILLFYRESKSAHPGAGFVYEGSFRYMSHSGSGPATFVFRRESTLA
jgi:hypothetical protein